MEGGLLWAVFWKRGFSSSALLVVSWNRCFWGTHFWFCYGGPCHQCVTRWLLGCSEWSQVVARVTLLWYSRQSLKCCKVVAKVFCVVVRAWQAFAIVSLIAIIVLPGGCQGDVDSVEGVLGSHQCVAKQLVQCSRYSLVCCQAFAMVFGAVAKAQLGACSGVTGSHQSIASWLLGYYRWSLGHIILNYNLKGADERLEGNLHHACLVFFLRCGGWTW